LTSFPSFLKESVLTDAASVNLRLPSPDARSQSCFVEELFRQSEMGDLSVSLLGCRKEDRSGVRGRHLGRDSSSSGLEQSSVSPLLRICYV
jgi:hypothetical protein